MGKEQFLIENTNQAAYLGQLVILFVVIYLIYKTFDNE